MTESSSNIVLSYKNIKKSFGELCAVNDVSFDVKRGEIFGFIGPDGAGKSTLIRIAMGILTQDSGVCTLLGSCDIKKARAHSGYVPQLFSLYPNMTVDENIALFGSLYDAPREDVMRRADMVLRRTGLWPFQDRMVNKLSGGMKQKLALAVGLLHTPHVLFLDEPTTGVDPVARREFWAMLYELNRDGLTIIVSTPYMDEAELCTRKMFINKGRILDIGTSSELLSRYQAKVLFMPYHDRRAKSWLLKCDSVLDANLFGQDYHIAVSDIKAASASICAKFDYMGIEMPKITEIKPTLEDLFVSFAENESKS